MFHKIFFCAFTLNLFLSPAVIVQSYEIHQDDYSRTYTEADESYQKNKQDYKSADIVYPENPDRTYPALDPEAQNYKRRKNPGYSSSSTGGFYQEVGVNTNDLIKEWDDEYYGRIESTIPINFIEQLNNYENVSDLLLNFVEGSSIETPTLINRFGEDERGSAKIPKQATCMPELQPVKIVNTTDSSIMYIPSCTRIERCGGCCSHPLLACRPVETETVSFQITKTQYTGGNKLKNLGKEIVLVEKHTKCRCGCRIQPEDCKDNQIYSKNECKCTCKNSDEQKKCIKNNATKLWNPNTCMCQCREILECSTGSNFDTNVCRCVMGPLRRRDIESRTNKRTGYKSKALPVIPLE